MLDSQEEALIAIKTIEVGVDTFSLTLESYSFHWPDFFYWPFLTLESDEIHILLSFDQLHLNKRESTEKEQMSTPLPATALKTPPT